MRFGRLLRERRREELDDVVEEAIDCVLRSCTICRTARSCDVEMRLFNGNYITVLKLPRTECDNWKSHLRTYLRDNPETLESLLAKCDNQED